MARASRIKPGMEMVTGLLWYDDDPGRSLEEKVLRAAAHYERKYGRAPNLCFIHPGAFNREARKIGGVEIRPGRFILPHHLWIGVADDGKARPRLLSPERARRLSMELECDGD